MTTSNLPPEQDDLVERLVQQEANQPEDLDLSEDAIQRGLSLSDQRDSDIRLDEWNHRKSLQISMFSSGVTFAALLYIVATIIGIIVAYGFATGKKTDWHLTLLAAAFVIPPTVIVTIIVRSVYAPASSTNDENLPALNLIKEIAVAVKEVLSAGK